MKVKKFFVLSILTVMMTMFFTGCNYDITEEFKESQRVAEEFLTTKGYEVPEGYTVRYLDESDRQLCVKVGETEIVFDISEGRPEMISIKDSKIATLSISRTSINEMEEVGKEFLNTTGYHIPQGYSIKYLGEDKKQLQVVSEVKNDNNDQIELMVTFDITEDKFEIIDIEWYIDKKASFISTLWIGFLFVVTFLVELKNS